MEDIVSKGHAFECPKCGFMINLSHMRFPINKDDMDELCCGACGTLIVPKVRDVIIKIIHDE